MGDGSIILDINHRPPHESISTHVCPHTCKNIHIGTCTPHTYIHEKWGWKKEKFMFAHHERSPIISQVPSCRGETMASFVTDPHNWQLPLVLAHWLPPWSLKSKFTKDKWNMRSSWLLAPGSSLVWFSVDHQGLGAANVRQITALTFRSMSKEETPAVRFRTSTWHTIPSHQSERHGERRWFWLVVRRICCNPTRVFMKWEPSSTRGKVFERCLTPQDIKAKFTLLLVPIPSHNYEMVENWGMIPNFQPHFKNVA